jgi:hypothetical protein
MKLKTIVKKKHVFRCWSTSWREANPTSTTIYPVFFFEINRSIKGVSGEGIREGTIKGERMIGKTTRREMVRRQMKKEKKRRKPKRKVTTFLTFYT